jgi:hypothetical protein
MGLILLSILLVAGGLYLLSAARDFFLILASFTILGDVQLFPSVGSGWLVVE